MVRGLLDRTRSEGSSMSDPSDSLVIFLHGVGANGADLAPLADTLLRRPRG
jgi:predicted esterase